MRNLLFVLFVLTAAAAQGEAPFGSGDLYGGVTGFGPSTTAESPWPWVGAAAAAAVFGFVLRARANRPGPHWVARARARRRHRRSVAHLRAADASFGGLNAEPLRSRFHGMVHQLAHCRAAGDLAPGASWLEPELLADERQAADQLKRDHELRRLDNLKITGLWFHTVELWPRPEITVLLQARAADYIVDREGQWKRGRPVIEPFQEYWTFRLEAGTWRLIRLGKE